MLSNTHPRNWKDSRMRRALSIPLILWFWLGPFAPMLETRDDARLPTCCRRHGAHQCASSMRTAAMMADTASGKPIFTAPATCPAFPGSTAATTTSPHPLAASTVSLPVLLAQMHAHAAGRATARLSQIRTRAGRGPPASSLA
jgi:hypothetical protein